jgi:cytochrome c5
MSAVNVAALKSTIMRSIGLCLAFVLASCGGGSSNSNDPGKPRPLGEQTYQRFCISCHASGINGAPRIGDAEAWRPRLAQGESVLLEHARQGMPSGGMPPNGMCGACTDQELLDATHYMANER